MTFDELKKKYHQNVKYFADNPGEKAKYEKAFDALVKELDEKFGMDEVITKQMFQMQQGHSWQFKEWCKSQLSYMQELYLHEERIDNAYAEFDRIGVTMALKKMDIWWMDLQKKYKEEINV